MDYDNKGLTSGFVRYKLSEGGWSSFFILIDYQEHDNRKWKIIIGKGIENVDCTYVMNVPNEKGELKDYFIVCDNSQYIKEQMIPADTVELVKFLNDKYPLHIPYVPKKNTRR